MVTVPSAAAAMAVEVSRLDAMLTVPHGFASVGRWVLPRLGVPWTPRAGLNKYAKKNAS